MVPLASRGYRFNAPEIKSFDVATATYGCDSNTPSITSICVPVQGTGFTNRIGTRIKVINVQVRGYVASNLARTQTGAADGNIPSHQVRATIVLDYQPNGAAPGITDIFTNTGPVGGLNLNNRDRFKILKEKTFSIDPYIVSTTVATEEYATAVNQTKSVKMFKKCDIPVYFNAGNAGTVSDLSSNNILLVLQSNLPTALGSTQFVLFTRCRFLDP